MGYRDAVQSHLGEGSLVPGPPPGVGVGPVDQGGDVADPVADYLGRVELGGGDLVPDDQDPVVAPGDV